MTLLEWVLAAIGGFFVGTAKGGFPGTGNISIAIFAEVFGGKPSVGVLLPVLISADIIAIIVYRKHAQWEHVLKLLPVAAIGIIIGYFLFDRIPSDHFKMLIGVLLLTITAAHFLRRWLISRRGTEDSIPSSWWFVAATGLAGGIATMLANAAGPILAFYLMSVKLPKYRFLGTSAWYFFIMNLFKVPFMIALGIIDKGSAQTSAFLGIFAVIGALIAPLLIKYVPQKAFEVFVWCIIVLGALKLIV
jgi:uncharacterized membrane protein YfcA